MQHSPQEIKTILDRVVDSDGNVLDMAAVLEVVTILERLPITKEALEKTRLGKTINLLRKKTTNEELAKRAKGLVKKWQKLVINHLETLRSADSPINGSRVTSPQINGTLKDTDKPASPSIDRGGKCKILEGKKRGIKRKRGSCSSSENSPTVFVKSDDSESLPGTPNSSQEAGLGGQKSVPGQSATQLSERECAVSVVREAHSPLSPIMQSSQSLIPLVGSDDRLPSALQAADSQSTEDNSILSVDSGICSQPSIQRVEKLNHEGQTIFSESELNDQCRSETTANKDSCILQVSHSSSIDDQAIGLNSRANIACHSDSDDELSQEIMLESGTLPSSTPKELILDVNVQANGVTGRYGSDGSWYDWTAVMPSSDGMLQVLPYVILE
ncbi:mediator of RNA polymerase II transcription subunit 26-like [Montipora foliosa]|uniref:mediator of RNA polymerase II transcription subunit 26-like n=1 Tax=Montipora foliosa TaxID=591990 RepID=UPI0035F1CED7